MHEKLSLLHNVNGNLSRIPKRPDLARLGQTWSDMVENKPTKKKKNVKQLERCMCIKTLNTLKDLNKQQF